MCTIHWKTLNTTHGSLFIVIAPPPTPAAADQMETPGRPHTDVFCFQHRLLCDTDVHRTIWYMYNIF